MKLNVQIINPITYSGWDDLLISCPGYSFFHTSTWSRVLSESYGYKSTYFTAFDNGKISYLIPMMEIDSLFTGKRGVSLPFTDYCDPVQNGNVQFDHQLNEIISYGKKNNWKYLELRRRESLFPSTPPSITYIGHILNLSNKEDKIFSSFKDIF